MNAANLARSVWLLAHREARVRATGTPLVLGTVALALLLIGYLLLQGLVFNRSETIRVGLAGQAIGLQSGLEAGARQLGLTVETSSVATVTEGTDEVRSGSLNVLVSGATDSLTVTVSHDLDPRLRTALDGLVRAQVLDAQFAEAGLRPSDVDTLLAQAGVKHVIQLYPSDPGRDDRLAAGLAVAFLLSCALAVTGTLAARETADERRSGMAESLLAVTPAGRLLAGRVIGLGALGLAQLALLGLLGIAVGAAAGVPIGGGARTLGYGLCWYALGFGFYGTAFTLSGTLASRRAELPRALTPVGALLAVGVLGGFTLLGLAGAERADDLVSALSVLPPFAPVLMPGRLALGAVPDWQVALAVLLMLGAIVAVARLAVRAYPAALLRQDGRPRLADLFTTR